MPPLAFLAPVFSFAGTVLAGTAFGTTGVGAVLSGVAQSAAFAALSAGASAIVANNSKPEVRGSSMTMSLDPCAPRRLWIGKQVSGGQLVDWLLYGEKNSRVLMPVYLSEGPFGRITKVYGGGRVVHETPLVHGVKTEITAYRSGQDGDPGPRLWLTFFDGRPDQEAAADLVALNQGWTVDDKMTGMAYVLVEAWFDSDNQRTPPQLAFEGEGAKLYDRRKDTTAGGSGSHRHDDPDTWEICDGDDTEGANPAVAIDHFVLGRYWNGKRVFGVGHPQNEVSYSNMSHHANISDEDVDLKEGGTQKRYRASGIIMADADHDTVIRKLADQMAATPNDFGGRFGIVGMEARTPILEIDDGDLIGEFGDFYSPKRPWTDLFSGVEGRYCEPEQNYSMTDYPRIDKAEWVEEDGDEARYYTHTLEFEINCERAQRLALLKGNMLRRQGTLRGMYPLWAIELERGDWFLRTGQRWGEDGKLFEVLDRVINTRNGAITIIANEVDPNDDAWDENDAKPPPTLPTPGTPYILGIDPPLIVATAISLVGTSFTKPAVRVEWAATTDPRVRYIFIEIWPTAGGQKMSATIALPSDINFAVFDNGIVDGVEYTVRARFLAVTLQSNWSSTTTLTPTIPFEIGGLSPQEIVDGLAVNASDIIRQQLLYSTWQAAFEALVWVEGEPVGEVALESKELAEGFAASMSLLGAANVGGTAFNLNLDSVIVPSTGIGVSATSLRSLRTDVLGSKAGVSFLLESIGGNYAGATLLTDVDGNIVGLKVWNNGDPQASGFAIVAPNFAIVDPANGLTSPFVPFSYADGVVKMPNVEVGYLKVNIVDTQHLIDNSVSDTLYAVDANHIGLPSNNTWAEVANDNFDSTNPTLEILYVIDIFRSTADGTRGRYSIRVKRNGTVVDTRASSNLYANSGSDPVTHENTFTMTSVPAGVNTWSVELKVDTGGGGWSGWTKTIARTTMREIKK